MCEENEVKCDLGIEVYGDTFTPIITAGMEFPCVMTKTFSTIFDNQKSIDVLILQGSYHCSNSNQKLGSVLLNDITQGTRGMPEIRVTFSVFDDDNELHVTVSDSQKKIKKKESFIIPEFIDPASEDISTFIKQDEQYYALLSVRHEADRFIQSCHHMLKESKLLENHPDEDILELLYQLQGEVTKAINSLKEQMKQEDSSTIQKCIETLSEKIKDLVQLFYQIDTKLP